MRFRFREHPIDSLSWSDRCDIYYSRVVDLAALSGLLTRDPMTEIGHFAFSDHYARGKALDRKLQKAIREFEQRHPHVADDRSEERNERFMGVVEDYRSSGDKEKIRDLIRVGASYRIWPTCTSFTLTYPWDLEGNGRPVRFRDDLSPFMKRRILEILKKADKLSDPHLFAELDEPPQ